MDTDFVKQRQMQICQRDRFSILNVASAFQAGSGTASHEDRQVRVIMNVGIADATSIEIESIVE